MPIRVIGKGASSASADGSASHRAADCRQKLAVVERFVQERKGAQMKSARAGSVVGATCHHDDGKPRPLFSQRGQVIKPTLPRQMMIENQARARMGAIGGGKPRRRVEILHGHSVRL